MALCFVHTAAGYLAYEGARPVETHHPGLLAAAVLLANGPDLDFLPGILVGHPGAYHRGFTHTLAAVVAVAAAVLVVGRVRRRPARAVARAALWAGAVYASHLLLDFFTSDVKPPSGGRFLWPLSEAYYLSPVTPLREIIIDPTSRLAFVRSLLTPQTLGVWAEEVAILVGTVVAVHAARAWRGSVGALLRGVPDRA
jgi:membrane-bound metal-dependent hydrolase YbcI (DUF457 family)